MTSTIESSTTQTGTIQTGTEASSTVERIADLTVKAKHRALWASGDYPRVATELIPQLGPTLVAAAGITAGQSVLDVAAGSGNAAIPAALRGARVIAVDLTPELLAAGGRQADERGVDLQWVEADAEALPYPDGSFDVVLSSVGVMFAPRHQRVADELVRVTRPGGTIGLINWTPQGLIGHLLKTLAPYAPPPAPGASPAPLWGEVDHVRQLFGDRVTGLEFRRQQIVMARGLEPVEFREYWKNHYGPTIAVYRHNADRPDRVAELDAAFLRLLTDWRHDDGGGAGYPAEYLLLTAHKATDD
jgi:2-polyprenyl-6-hydroxyphenyl methylase/3-demethylubiquinone-9 3-methyltransferase